LNLFKMKEIAEMRLGRKITQAVLAIPGKILGIFSPYKVEFNEKQRKATEEAGRLAGNWSTEFFNRLTS
jgi:molecular chaperone DnaK (HSP70)